MKFIERKYGNDGYATWFKLLEKIAHNDYHYLDLRKKQHYELIASYCIPEISVNKIQQYGDISSLFGHIVKDLIVFDVFDEDLWTNHQILWCQQLVDSLKYVYDKRENSLPTIQNIRDLISGLSVTDINVIESDSSVSVSNTSDSNSVNGFPSVTKLNSTKLNSTKLNSTKLKERKTDFVKILEPFIDSYGKQLIREFYEYWTEHSPNGYKMRFEKEKVFDVKRRLSTWKKRSSNFNTQTTQTNNVTWG